MAELLMSSSQVKGTPTRAKQPAIPRTILSQSFLDFAPQNHKKRLAKNLIESFGILH